MSSVINLTNKMEIKENEIDYSNLPKPKKYLLIKLPCKINNKEKAINCLGGAKNIINKNIKNENIELRLLYKKINLEKCLSNDILIKRKTKRKKNNKKEKKYEYQTIGKISGQYECFSMHDFIIDSNNSIVPIDELKQFSIFKDDYLKELDKIKKEKEESDSKTNENQNYYSQTQKTQAIHNLHEKANVDLGYEKMNVNDICSFFQPNHIANLRNSYPKPFKELFEDFKLEYADNF